MYYYRCQDGGYAIKSVCLSFFIRHSLDRKKVQMKFSLLWESMGNFSILAVFERYLSNACTDPHQILFVYGQCLPTCPLPCGIHRPLGGGGGGVKNSNNWEWSHSCSGQLPFVFFSAMPNVVRYVGHRPAHKIGQGVSTGWAKNFEKISNFSPFRDFSPYISETIKNRGI